MHDGPDSKSNDRVLASTGSRVASTSTLALPEESSPIHISATPERPHFTLWQVMGVLRCVNHFMGVEEPLLLKMNPYNSLILRKLESEFYPRFLSDPYISIEAMQDFFSSLPAEVTKSDLNLGLGYAYKSTFFHAQILNGNDIGVLVSNRIFYEELREILNEFRSKIHQFEQRDGKPNFKVIPEERIINCFRKMMGQLEKRGQADSLNAIHYFLYIAKKIAIAEETKSPNEGIDYAASLISPCLQKCFMLTSKICSPADYAKSDVAFKDPVSEAMRNESRFVTYLTRTVLMLPLFDKIYRPGTYHEWKQPEFEDLFLKTEGSLHHFIDTQWPASKMREKGKKKKSTFSLLNKFRGVEKIKPDPRLTSSSAVDLASFNLQGDALSLSKKMGTLSLTDEGTQSAPITSHASSSTPTDTGPLQLRGAVRVMIPLLEMNQVMDDEGDMQAGRSYLPSRRIKERKRTPRPVCIPVDANSNNEHDIDPLGENKSMPSLI